MGWISGLIALINLVLALLLLAVPLSLIVAFWALVIGLIRRRNDRAIRMLDGFPVTLELAVGTRRSGVLNIQRDGLTLSYALPATGRTPTIAITYLHYQAEWRTINAIYRFTDELSKEDRALRERQLQQNAHFWRTSRRWQPGKWLDRFTERMIRFWAALRDKDFPEPYFQTLPQAQRQWLTGYAGDNDNALLEENLNKPVVAAHVSQDVLHRHQGTLLAYSRYFLLLAQTPVPQPVQVRLRPEKGAGQELTLRWRWKNGQIEIQNLGTYPLLLDAIKLGPTTRDLSMMIDAQASFTLHADAPDRGETILLARITREADVLLPRNRAIVRYAANLPGYLAALDVGLALTPPAADDAEEQRLRQALKAHPTDPAVAAALARYLHRQGRLDEAETYYERALDAASRLPDSGERVQLELAHLRMYQKDEREVSP